MKSKAAIILAVLCLTAVACSPQGETPAATRSPKATVDTVYDYLDRSRAVNVYLNSIPTLSMNALREGLASAGCALSHQVCIFDTLMDSKSLFLTGNTSTMYALGFLDLKKGGKFLVLPPGYEGNVPDGYYVVPSKT